MESLRGSNASNKTLALQLDADGKLRHDAISRVGHAADKVYKKKIFYYLCF